MVTRFTPCLWKSLLWAVLVTFGLAGCNVAPVPSRAEPSYNPVWPEVTPPVAASPGSLYQVSHNLSLFDDRRALAVGDVITINLEEQTRSSKSSETRVRKDSNTQLLNPTVFGNLIQGSTADSGILNGTDSASEFTGSGESDQSNSLSGTITAVVARVLPNGLLQVQGEKWLKLNQGEEYVRVSGLVRSEDIGSDNAVSSLRLADARIAYSGTGALAQANEAGWLTRFFTSTLSPF